MSYSKQVTIYCQQSSKTTTWNQWNSLVEAEGRHVGKEPWLSAGFEFLFPKFLVKAREDNRTEIELSRNDGTNDTWCERGLSQTHFTQTCRHKPFEVDTSEVYLSSLWPYFLVQLTHMLCIFRPCISTRNRCFLKVWTWRFILFKSTRWNKRIEHFGSSL